MNDEFENQAETNVSDPLPVDNPDLPLDGDPEDHGEEPVQEELRRSAESQEQLDEPNDLSEIDKEFEDEDEGGDSIGRGNS